VQALWLNALRIGSRFSERWAALHARARAAFEARFWNEARGALHDVVDADIGRRGGSELPPEPDLRGRRAAVRGARGREGTPGSSTPSRRAS